MPAKRTSRAERLKIDMPWGAAIGKALRKEKPADGWPKPAPMPQRARKDRPAKKSK